MQSNYKTAQQFKDENGYVIDDVWYPRVTAIVSIKSKPGLANFFQTVGSQEKADAIKQKSADEGTLVHEAVEALLLGQNPEIPPEIAAATKAFQVFNDGAKIESKPEWVEKRICHGTERYAGTIDALATIDGKFGVLDIKTSQAIYRDYNLQTAAYFASLHDQFPDLQTRWILRIDQIRKCHACGATKRTKGGYEKIRNAFYDGLVHPCDPKNHEWSDMKGVIELQEFPLWQDDYHAFLGAKRLWEWEHAHWLKKIGYN